MWNFVTVDTNVCVSQVLVINIIVKGRAISDSMVMAVFLENFGSIWVAVSLYCPWQQLLVCDEDLLVHDSMIVSLSSKTWCQDESET